MASVDDSFLKDFGFVDDQDVEELGKSETGFLDVKGLESVAEVLKDEDISLDFLSSPDVEEKKTSSEEELQEPSNALLSEEEIKVLRSIILDEDHLLTSSEPTQKEDHSEVEPPREEYAVVEDRLISDIPVIDAEREADILVIKDKKIKTPEECRLLAEEKAKQKADQLSIFKRIAQEAVEQLSSLPSINKQKIFEACERAQITLEPMPDFRACISLLSKAQNVYSELSDYYEVAYSVYQQWRRHKEKLFKAFYVISSMPSDNTREGEAYLYMSKIADREAEYKTVVERLEISMKKVALIREAASRMITALENQYTAFGALRPSMDYEGPVKES